MLTLKQMPNRARHSSPGDFAVEVRDHELLVPHELAEVLDDLRVRTAEEFVSYLDTFPSAVAEELGWNLDELKTAQSRLISILRGIVSDEILSPKRRHRRVYGALEPVR